MTAGGPYEQTDPQPGTRPADAARPDLAAVILAGGRAQRMGGEAKPTRLVGGRPLLLRVLDAATYASPRIVVGPPELTPMLPGRTSLTTERQRFAGPVMGIAAGVALVPAHVAKVATLSCDLPFLNAAVLSGLSDLASRRVDVAVLLDGNNRPQWTAAVWRREVLAHRLATMGRHDGARMRDLCADLSVATLAWPVESGPPPWFDCDTEQDIARAEELLDEYR